MRRRERFSREVRGVASLVGASPFRILTGGRRRGRVTAQSFWVAMARWSVLWRSSEELACLERLERASIPALHCKRRLSCLPARAWKLYGSWVSRKIGNKCASCSAAIALQT